MTTSIKQLGITAACCCALLLSACAEDKADKAEQSPKVTIDKNPFPSKYTPLPGAPTVITGVTILDGIGNKIDNGMVYFSLLSANLLEMVCFEIDRFEIL